MSKNQKNLSAGYEGGFDVFRIVSSQPSCRSLSKILEAEVLTPTETNIGYQECSIKTDFPV